MYTIDRWNNIDFLYSVFHIIYIISALSLGIDSEVAKASFVICVVLNFIGFLRILGLTKQLGNTVDAILSIGINAVKIATLDFVIWCGFAVSGWVLLHDEINAVLMNEQESSNNTTSENYIFHPTVTFYESCSFFFAILFKSIIGLVEFDDFNDNFDLNSFSTKVFIGLYFLVMMVVVINGLVSIMTFSLDNDMSAEYGRQRRNILRYNFLQRQKTTSFWPVPFKGIGWIVDTMTKKYGQMFHICNQYFSKRKVRQKIYFGYYEVFG